MIKIGLLEFGLRDPDAPPAEILEDVMAYAVRADKLGFSRLWLTEHHRLSPAWNTPEIILPIIAGLTSNIKVGIGGVLLTIHSPYRIALTYKLLNTLFPGRIDLGLANGKPKYPVAKLMLSNKHVSEDFRMEFDERLEELTKLLRIDGLYQHDMVMVTPYPADIPEIWNLRSSADSLDISLRLKLHSSLSLFHKEFDIHQEKDKIAAFRDAYFSRYDEQPVINFSFSGVCLKSSQKAEKLYTEMGYKYDEYPFNCLVGSPSLYQDKLLYMKEDLGIDEFLFNDLCRDNKERLNTLHLLSRTFELQPQKKSMLVLNNQ